jgi:hypothetical protein
MKLQSRLHLNWKQVHLLQVSVMRMHKSLLPILKKNYKLLIWSSRRITTKATERNQEG